MLYLKYQFHRPSFPSRILNGFLWPVTVKPPNILQMQSANHGLHDIISTWNSFALVHYLSNSYHSFTHPIIHLHHTYLINPICTRLPAMMAHMIDHLHRIWIQQLWSCCCVLAIQQDVQDQRDVVPDLTQIHILVRCPQDRNNGPSDVMMLHVYRLWTLLAYKGSSC